MAEIRIDIKKTIESSHEIISIAEKLEKLKSELDNVKASGILDSQSGREINRAIIKISEEISNEATKMNSLGDALQVIAHKYQALERQLRVHRLRFSKVTQAQRRQSQERIKEIGGKSFGIG